MAIIFQSILFDSARDAHLACAEEWLIGGGLNNREEILKAFNEASNEELAKECNEMWGMDCVYPDEDPYCRENWFVLGELEQAFADIREDPEYYFSWGEE